ncbi:MAG TPA: hypothetical protein VF319_02630 [Caldimonas sp.]
MLAGPQPDVAAPDTTFHPELVALTCHEVLARAGDPRAAAWLEQARVLLWAVANRIPDARSGRRTWRRCRIGARSSPRAEQRFDSHLHAFFIGLCHG